jgi:ribosomal protein S20
VGLFAFRSDGRGSCRAATTAILARSDEGDGDTMSKVRFFGFSAAMVTSALLGGTLISAVLASGPAASSGGSQAGPVNASVLTGTMSDGTLIAAPTTAPSATTPAATASAATASAATASAVPAATASTVPAATTPAATASPSPACLAFRRTLAADLGVTEEQLVAATKDALGAAIDQAVKDGKLSADRAATLKARIAAADGDGCRIPHPPIGRILRAGIGARADALVAAAGSLDLTPTELRSALRTAGSLRAVAETKGVPYDQVSAAALAAVKRDADARVSTGDLTRAQADRLVARIEHRLAEGWVVPATPASNG